MPLPVVVSPERLSSPLNDALPSPPSAFPSPSTSRMKFLHWLPMVLRITLQLLSRAQFTRPPTTYIGLFLQPDLLANQTLNQIDLLIFIYSLETI